MSTAQIKDIAMYYETAGDHGAYVLLIHDMGGDSGDWYPATIERLAENHQVIRYDMRGRGKTRRAGGEDALDELAVDEIAIEDHANDALQLLNHLGVTAAHIVALDLGGRIAGQIAHMYPDRVLSLVVTDSPGGVTPAAPPQEVNVPVLVQRQARPGRWSAERVENAAVRENPGVQDVAGSDVSGAEAVDEILTFLGELEAKGG